MSRIAGIGTSIDRSVTFGPGKTKRNVALDLGGPRLVSLQNATATTVRFFASQVDRGADLPPWGTQNFVIIDNSWRSQPKCGRCIFCISKMLTWKTKFLLIACTYKLRTIKAIIQDGHLYFSNSKLVVRRLLCAFTYPIHTYIVDADH